MPSPDLVQLYKDFDHTARLEQTHVYVERPRAPARSIAQQLPLKPGKHWIFCGSIGAGKSSELAFLGHLLDNNANPRYFVVGLDVYQSIDDVTTILPAEMLMLIGAAVVQTYQDWHSKKIPAEKLERLREAFTGAMDGGRRRLEPKQIFEGVALLTWGTATADLATTGGAVGSLVGAMGGLVKGKHRTSLGGLTRASAREGDPDVAALVDAVNDILDHVREHDGRTPVILIDGLDKIDRVEDTDTIRQLFCARLLSTISATCVYSAPVTMMLDAEWNRANAYFERERLNSVIVSTPLRGAPEPTLVAQGRALMRDVVSKRLAQRGLVESDLFDEGGLDELITESGGVLRTIVHLVRNSIYAAIREGAPRVARAHVDEAIHEFAMEFEITMNGRRRAELKVIAEQGEPSGDDTRYELLLSNYVLPYRNGHSWWAPAPAVARILGRG